MKILIITPYFFEAHRWMISGYKTALNLSKKHQLVVLTTGTPKYQKINPNLKIYRMPDWFIPDPINLSIVPGFFGSLKKIIRKEKPEVFLVNKNMFYTSLTIIPLKFWRKRVYTQVDTFPGINWFSKSWLVNIVLWLYSRTIGMWLLKLSDKVILLHEGLIPVARRYHLRYVVIHNGVDMELMRKAKPAKDIAIKNKEIRIVYVGRLESVKRYEDYLLVAKTMVSKNPRLKFYVVGDISGRDKIVRQYSSPKIIFLGHRQDVYSILKTMDIFVLPSKSEGLPNALMEAMASGLACIAANVGGVKVLLKNNVNGLTYPSGNLRALRKKIDLAINNPKLRDRLSKHAFQTIMNSYNWEKITKEYELLFRG